MNKRTSESELELGNRNSAAQAAGQTVQTQGPAGRTVGSPAWQARWLEVLKHRVLLRYLDQAFLHESHAVLIREADEAVILAWLTGVPLLVFPCLFEERAAVAFERQRLQLRNYWRALDLVTAA
jgi:hypothetical protein